MNTLMLVSVYFCLCNAGVSLWHHDGKESLVWLVFTLASLLCVPVKTKVKT